MKKSFFLLLIGIATSFISFILMSHEVHKKIQKSLQDRRRFIQLRNNDHFPIQLAGDPLIDAPENSNMISEGSQYGVDFYNRVKQ
ncbi:hypothetical protein KQI76_10415 [Amphibacillus sp. MSJ-3]|uniref:hypothetical protein n=1 Tax=Amphibacillus sp. MSJ-3 TaxID=2841505 RepID=UPI001C0E93F9|nr:hypothetical protein [Amphibacillus sp. MSJ-3]MBU5595565.1 hypothetical protein [Amphibacillus sp. MSJ-3]